MNPGERPFVDGEGTGSHPYDVDAPPDGINRNHMRSLRSMTSVPVQSSAAADPLSKKRWSQEDQPGLCIGDKQHEWKPNGDCKRCRYKSKGWHTQKMTDRAKADLAHAALVRQARLAKENAERIRLEHFLKVRQEAELLERQVKLDEQTDAIVSQIENATCGFCLTNVGRKTGVYCTCCCNVFHSSCICKWEQLRQKMTSPFSCPMCKTTYVATMPHVSGADAGTMQRICKTVA